MVDRESENIHAHVSAVLWHMCIRMCVDNEKFEQSLSRILSVRN